MGRSRRRFSSIGDGLAKRAIAVNATAEAAVAPGDALFAKLANLSRDALARHLTAPICEQSASIPALLLAPEVVAAIERLEGREPHHPRGAAPAEKPG